MPCSDSSLGLNMRLDAHDRLIEFDCAKITCLREIDSRRRLSSWCSDKTLLEILGLDFRMLVSALGLNADEEGQFILYLELEALKSAIVEYLGMTYPGVDSGRCQLTSVTHGDEGTEVSAVILVPRELPKIVPCGFIREGQ